MFRKLMRGFIVAMTALVVATIAAPAHAGGSVRLGKSTVAESSSGTWKLKFTIDYGKQPHLAHVPMVFSFKQTGIYERSLTDDNPDTPIERTIQVRNAEPNNVPVDVGFSDSQGKMFRVTKFSIKLRRDADFEAGEYELTVKESQSGRRIGGKIRIKLKGKNKVVNRKAMDFTSRSKPKPKPEPSLDEKKPDDSEVVASEDRGPDLSDIPDVADDEIETPGKVEPKQGGCGCIVVGSNASPQRSLPVGWALCALATGLVLARRRRRHAA